MTLARSERLTVAAAAVMLTLAYPPFALLWPAFVCLVPAALLILQGATKAEPTRWRLHVGFWYGTVTHAVLLYWLAGALWRYAGAGVAVVLYAAAVTAFGGVTAVVFAAVGRASDGSPTRLALALPAGIVLLEWLAGQAGPIALPWHQLALTVTSAPILVQTADIAGAQGLGFLIAMINTLIALAWWERGARRRWLHRLESAATLLLLMALYGMHRMETVPLREVGSVGVVQPNASVEDKRRPSWQDELVERTARLTERAIVDGATDLVVWPETALPAPIETHAAWRARLMQLTRRRGVTVVTGGVTGAGGGGPRTNAALAFAPGADYRSSGVVLHRKNKLVPFVERVGTSGPDLSGTGGGFEPGHTLVTSAGPLGSYGALICYELTFGDLPRTLRRSGAQLLVVLSSDTWLGRGSAPAQHFAHAVLRAVENRMPVVRSANTGVSGVVDPLGRVVARTPVFEAAYLVAEIESTPVVPPAVRLGGLAGPAALVLLFVLAVFVPAVGESSARAAPSRVPSPLIGATL